MSGVAIKKKQQKEAGVPKTSLLIPRSSVNIPGT